MSYAQHRKIIDADSHVIELDDFLQKAALKADLPLLLPMNKQSVLPVDQKRHDRARVMYEQRQADPSLTLPMEETILDNKKSGWERLGAFDPEERTRALNLFGYELQWVLPTFTFHQVAHLTDPVALEAGARTLNKAMADFCRSDSRLLAIGYLPLSLGPAKALELMRQGFDDGCYSFMIPTTEPDNSKPSFTHPDFDEIWALFSDRNVPFTCHVAADGGVSSVAESFRNNGKTLLELGGDAPAGELGLLTIGNTVQIFLAAMIYDGVFERHSGLRCVSLEFGASWLPAWLKMLDFGTKLFSRKRKFDRDPADIARERIKVAPFGGEPVGWIMEQVGADMLVYASDYPHPEGTSDPIGKFEATMSNYTEADFDLFYHGNMQQLMGI
ncbi:MAG: amidohydrolase family protein [Oceanicoccus sp.]